MISKYFIGSIVTAVIGLLLGSAVGYIYSETYAGALAAGLLTALLAVLEVSLSIDNAVVNATVLKRMTPLWQRRFITWGMLIAVFGMRLIFPLAIVSVVAGISPWAAIQMAAMRPDDYAQTMLKSHHVVSGFGGAFLMMVALKYFFNSEKVVHWFHLVEKPLIHLGKIEAIEIALCLLVMYLLTSHLPAGDGFGFLLAGIFGLITYVVVDGIGAFLQAPTGGSTTDIHRASIGMFLYLEVLDASFSFDGVVGAFALTHNLFIISIGLGIGAMFVRSLTIMFVDKGSLDHFRYLEHGAFYAIGALAMIMLLDPFFHIPEMVTGLLGAGFIALSVFSSIRYTRAQKNACI